MGLVSVLLGLVFSTVKGPITWKFASYQSSFFYSFFPNDSIADLWMFALRYVHLSSVDTSPVAEGRAMMERGNEVVSSSWTPVDLVVWNAVICWGLVQPADDERVVGITVSTTVTPTTIGDSSWRPNSTPIKTWLITRNCCRPCCTFYDFSLKMEYLCIAQCLGSC